MKPGHSNDQISVKSDIDVKIKEAALAKKRAAFEEEHVEIFK